MGFEAPDTVYKLQFADEKLNGLEVRVKAFAFQDVLDNEAILYGGWLYDPDLSAEEKAAKRDELHRLFAGQLVDWNLEKNGQPVPATFEGLRSQEVPLVGTIISAWRDNAIGVAIPLEQPSTDGEPSVEASIPMESPSDLPES